MGTELERDVEVLGEIYFDGAWRRGEGAGYQAVDPATGGRLAPEMRSANAAQVDAAVAAAHRAFLVYRNTGPAERAAFLRACADEIMALGDVLVERVTAETGYGQARVEGERARTCNQLRLFADYVEHGEHFDARIDTAQPDRTPLPKADIRSVNHALGPVVVFGAGNFPLAFSVAGGDAASALAAGCPVLAKGHPSHPGTCELVARAMARAAVRCGMPAGVFSLLMDAGTDVGAQLVSAAEVKAVGFTGSFAGGMALYKLAAQRPEPIPVFAEMGSINPVIVLPEALRERAETIAQQYVASMTLGTGQFCVKPGLVLALAGRELDAFVAAAAEALSAVGPGVMLNDRICRAYQQGVEAYCQVDGVQVAATGEAVDEGDGYRAEAMLLRTSAARFLERPQIHEEIFGPVSLLVECTDKDELLAVADRLAGQLSGTIHCSEDELKSYAELVDLLTLKVGRVVINGFPTGVEVCPSMFHGGPFPASTDARFTSVGTAAIRRFLRAVCYQNYPPALLPAALQNDNPLKLMRTVNGRLTPEPID